MEFSIPKPSFGRYATEVVRLTAAEAVALLAFANETIGS